MQREALIEGPISKSILLFSVPMILGNILQQMYNVADTFIVGRFIGAEALAAVGSSYTLMVFLTSILLGLCMGSGAVFAIRYGAKDMDALKNSVFVSFIMIGIITVMINTISFFYIDTILHFLKVPAEIYNMMRQYLQIIFMGICFTFLYNYCASLLRAVGNSIVPLIFLAIAAVLNVILDVYFIAELNYGVEGAAAATLIAQMFSAVGIIIYTVKKVELVHLEKKHLHINKKTMKEVFHMSILTCVQQSVMNFGILMIQGLVNSFGTVVMAAFAVAVKIDSFAYMPAQDFGNAFSVFVSQNYGANQKERIREGMKCSMGISVAFSIVMSFVVCIFASPFMRIFVKPEETQIIAIGVQYLRIVGVFYAGIGCLFLLYGYYRAVKKPGMSVVLTVISLGTRVLLAYILASVGEIGYIGIWWAIPIGWLLADIVGVAYLVVYNRDSGLKKNVIQPKR